MALRLAIAEAQVIHSALAPRLLPQGRFELIEVAVEHRRQRWVQR